MGSGNITRNLELVRIRTELLRDRLNRLYDLLRQRPHGSGVWGRFSYLWDLKELALLEKKDSVDVPVQWMDEFDMLYVREEHGLGRGH